MTDKINQQILEALKEQISEQRETNRILLTERNQGILKSCVDELRAKRLEIQAASRRLKMSQREVQQANRQSV